MRFTKMLGLGNDYVYVNALRERVEDPSALSRAISDRHFGAGSDGLVLILPSAEADFRMRMFNADGSEAEMCGNAARCIGKYVYEKGLTRKREISLQTGSGIRRLSLETEGETVISVEVDMGSPVFQPDRIPVVVTGDRAVNIPVEADGHSFEMTCVSMGNPHAVIFVEDAERFDVHRFGPLLEHNRLFPQRANIEFATVEHSNQIRMRVWERGSGETMACGTGACATLAAAVQTGRSGRQARVRLNGGTLEIRWDEKTGHIFQKGPAVSVYEGEWPEP